MRAAFARVEAEPPPPSLLLHPRPQANPLLSASGAGARSARERVSKRFTFVGVACGRRCDTVRPVQTGLSTLAAFAAGAITAFVGIFIADRLHAPPFSDNIHAPAADKGLAERTLSALSAFKPSRIANSSSAAAGKPALAPNQNTLVIPNLSAAGLTLVGVRAAPGLAGPEADSMLCLFYAKAAEPPFALCVARDGNGGAPVSIYPANSQAMAAQASSAGAKRTLSTHSPAPFPRRNCESSPIASAPRSRLSTRGESPPPPLQKEPAISFAKP